MSFNLLALETSTEQCSVALLAHGEIKELTSEGGPKASLNILPMVDELLKTQKIFLAQLHAITFGQGPGTFTGVRLAASVAQGLAIAHRLPVIPISSLACLAQQAYLQFSVTEVIAALDARMGAIYWGGYKLSENKTMQAVIPDAIQKIGESWDKEQWIGAGPGAHLIPDLREWLPNCYPTAKALIHLAIPKLEKGETVQPEEALPVYLRAAV